MGVDYYGVLNLKRDCSLRDVQQAYRRMALKCSPDRVEHAEGWSKADALQLFGLVSEAYEALADPRTRAVFDRFGEEGLKKGISTDSECIAQPFAYHGDPTRTFRDFFGTSNPYTIDLLNCLENPMPLQTSSSGKSHFQSKDPPVIRPLLLTLNEIFVGGVKKMKIERLVYTDDKCTELKLANTILSIPFEPGVLPDTTIVFEQEGDQGPMRIPGDVIFVTEDRPHERFRRLGRSDLLALYSLSLEEALLGTAVRVDTLDGRVVRLPLTEVVVPGRELVVEGEGLPVAGSPDKRGNLVVRFSVKFPEYITRDGRMALRRAFRACARPQKKCQK